MSGPQDPTSAPSIRSSIQVGGDLSGQVATGVDIAQQQSVGAPVTEADRAELATAVEAIRETVRRTAPADVSGDALDRVDELEAALTADQPRLSAIEYVRDWLNDHVRPAGEAVGRLVVSPLVAKFVAAGGEVLVAEFRRRFGIG